MVAVPLSENCRQEERKTHQQDTLYKGTQRVWRKGAAASSVIDGVYETMMIPYVSVVEKTTMRLYIDGGNMLVEVGITDEKQPVAFLTCTGAQSGGEAFIEDELAVSRGRLISRLNAGCDLQ